MGYLLDYLRQKAPMSGREMPLYYRRALSFGADALAVYFLVSCLIYSVIAARLVWVPVALGAGMILCRASVGRANVRLSTYGCALLVTGWCIWQSWAIGWGWAQHLLIPMVMLIFFNVYEPSWAKALAPFVAVAVQMALFHYTLSHAAAIALERSEIIPCHTIDTLTLFFILTVDFVLFSSSVQATERQLRLDNQELHKEAGTDPLTQLPNRRAMLDVIEAYQKEHPLEQFCIAIADIDFFKKVNDTYGHNCGDYTLKELSRLFRENAPQHYSVCRWGGEEFCFFLPGKNLDEAGIILFAVHESVRRLPLHFDGVDFGITITIGVAENDFQSPMEKLLEQADQKLYRGKLEGRNRLVI